MALYTTSFNDIELVNSAWNIAKTGFMNNFDVSTEGSSQRGE
jgi:hypothetical protein